MVGSQSLILTSAFLFSIAAALPHDSATALSTRGLHIRATKYDSSCDEEIPESFGGPKGRTYSQKAGQAFADAATIARVTVDNKMHDGTTFTESASFRHYFSPDQEDQVKKMMATIYANNQPDDSLHLGDGYTFTVQCTSKKDAECKPGVLAVTNAKPDNPVMTLCDDFFKSSTTQTKNDLSSKEIGSRRGQWCQQGEKFGFFEVAGVTAFHEMTHLDLVGNKAGLPAEDDQDEDGNTFQSHGTIDINAIGEPSDTDKYKGKDSYQVSRTLNSLWADYNGDNTKYKPLRPQTQNAESYAAVALEWYFQAMCDFDTIEADTFDIFRGWFGFLLPGISPPS